MEFPDNWCLQRSHEGDEPFAVAEDFNDKTDRYDIPAEFLDNSPKGSSSALSFLSIEDFRFYLPAYLLACINNALQRADLLFCLTYGFINNELNQKLNPRRYGAMTYDDSQHHRMSVFNTRQRTCIVAYLQYKMHDGDVSAIEQERLTEALKNYWLL